MKPTVPSVSKTGRAFQHLRQLLPLTTAFLLFAWTPVVLSQGKDASQAPSQDDLSQLSIERIYGQREFNAKGFDGRWLPATFGEGHDYVTLEASASTDGAKEIVATDALSGERKVLVAGEMLLPDDEARPVAIEDYQFSADRSLVLIYTNSKRVWRRRSRGDYWILDRSSRTIRKLASHAAPATTQFAKISPDSSKVAYVIDGDIFVEDVRSGAVQKVTKKTSDKIINGTFDWVYEEEFGLRDGFRWSPDSQRIAYWQLDTTGVPVFTMINNTDSMYPRLIQFAHPKTGQRNSACRVGVVSAEGGPTQWVRFAGENFAGENFGGEDPSEHYIARMDWIPDSNQLVMQRLNRLQNTNRLIRFDVATGKLSTLLTEGDETWIDVRDELHWLDKGQKFTWTSERSGWRQIYIGSVETTLLKRITSDEFDVMSLLHVDESAGGVYFTASPGNATQQYLYQANLDGTGMRRITPDEGFAGTNSYQISANGTLAIHTHSSANKPPTVRLVSLPSHEEVRMLESNEELAEKIAALDLSPVELFTIDTGDVEMDAWCVAPPNRKPGEKYPLLCYVYGEPAGSTVADRWGGNTFLWHAMLAQQGHVVVSIDNRGTKVAKGRAWRKSIYRQVGIIAPQDQAAAVDKLIATRPYIDGTRVGIWGWSGGGSMALNAIFKFPDLYKMAISIAPVPNQRYYDTIYQERYMGLPNDNVDGYRDGSPLNFASQLKGDLLLIHGTGDDNCHYQTMEMLINELIHHNKPFSMMAYPNRSHSIREGQNTSRHLRELMTRYILQNL